MDTDIKVVATSLFRYPIKSCSGELVERLEFDADGRLLGDREWVVVDSNSEMVWQGAYPRLALISATLEIGRLRVASPLGKVDVLSSESRASACKIKLWNENSARHDQFQGFDAGDIVAELVATTVGAPLRVVRLSEEALQRPNTNVLHLISASAVDEYLRALPQDAEQAIRSTNFRSNVVLDGEWINALPFIEERFLSLSWHEGESKHALSNFRACFRCAMTNVDAVTGEVRVAPLKTLAELSQQRNPGQPICFGVYATPSANSVLRVGAMLTPRLSF